MGCLKSLFKKILLIIIIAAFFALGGYTYIKEVINSYQNPKRADFIKEERNYGDFSQVSSDYQLCRDFNLFGYKKISVKYLPTGQKITVFDLKNENRITPNDFKTKEIDKKIDTLLNSFKESLITLDHFQITQRGVYSAKGKLIPYVQFNSRVKNVPFKTLTGVIAAYTTDNYNKKGKKIGTSTKLIMTTVDSKAFNPMIQQGFISAIRF